MFTLKVFNKCSNNLVFIKEHISKNDIAMYINRIIDNGIYQLVDYKVIKEEV